MTSKTDAQHADAGKRSASAIAEQRSAWLERHPVDIPVSASLVLFNNEGEAERAVGTLLSHNSNPGLQVYVVDNGSTDECLEHILSVHPQVHGIETGENIGFGGGHNKVLPLISSKYHAFVNPDIVFEYDTLSSIVSFMEANPQIVLVVPRLLDENHVEQNVAKIKPHPKHLLAGRYLDHGRPFTTWRREYTWSDRELTVPTDIEVSSGAFFVIRTDVLKAIGGFDERFFLYFEDFDMGLRARKHGRVVYDPYDYVIHQWERGYMSDNDLFKIELKSMLKFFRKWGWFSPREHPRK
jgi:GT2 family glycosyltransferase